MPRLDNSDPNILAVVQEWGHAERWSEPFNPQDPGKTPPIDACDHCHAQFFHYAPVVDHPSYVDDPFTTYTCAICMDPLGEEDD